MNIVLPIIYILLAVNLALFLVYIFRLDMKLVKAFEPMMKKHYDKIEKDSNL